MLEKRVLFIGLVWPEKTSSAASQNIISYVKLFKEAGCEICFASAADKSPMSSPLGSIVDHEQQIELNSSSFNDFLRSFEPEIVVFDRYISEEQFGWRVSQELPHCLKLLDCEDLHFLRDARHQAYKSNTDASLLESIEPFIYSDMCKREIASILRCDLSILLSDKEVDLLTKHFNVPPRLLHHCRFLIEQVNTGLRHQDGNDEKKHMQVQNYEEREDFVSIGNFRHAPNWDAVLTIKTKLWPLIKKQIPEAKCHIYGAYLPPKAKQLENKKDDFLVHGYAEDALKVIKDARVLLAPLNFGAGIKGKLVDAMICDTPSITTPIGAEGLGSESGWPGAVLPIHSNAETFSQRAVAIYANKEQWVTASIAAQGHLSTLFDYDQQCELLISAVQHLLRNLEQHRKQHFIGQIMQHHSMASTKFMSQWIEAKNKLS